VQQEEMFVVDTTETSIFLCFSSRGWVGVFVFLWRHGRRRPRCWESDTDGL